jgi:hypothetical protein
VRLDLREGVFAAAEADLDPKGRARHGEGAARVAQLVRREAKARQRRIQQKLLARPQRMAAATAIEAVGDALGHHGFALHVVPLLGPIDRQWRSPAGTWINLRLLRAATACLSS